MSLTRSVARRMFELVEPIGVIPYSADEPNEAMFALGFTNYWDTSLLREHRGDGHNAVLLSEGVGRLEAHVLFALGNDIPARQFGRIHHLPAAQLDEVIDGMRQRGLIGIDDWLSETGRALSQRVESRTDGLAAKPYECLEASELDELIGFLEPIAEVLVAAQRFE